MLIAIITDLHGYWPGWAWSAERIAERQPDEVWCLGDIVDGGGRDEDVARAVRDAADIFVQGNHDIDNPLDLAPDVAQWLQDLPTRVDRYGWLLTHMSPRFKNELIRDEFGAWNAFDDADFELAMIGHSHVPAIYAWREGMGAAAQPTPLEPGRYTLEPGFRYLVAAPSQAYNRGVQDAPAMILLDTETRAIEALRSSVPAMPRGPGGGSLKLADLL